MAPPPIRLLYLAGAGRSGITLLAALLDAHPGFHAIHPRPPAAVRHQVRGKPCGCGRPFAQCPGMGAEEPAP